MDNLSGSASWQVGDREINYTSGEESPDVIVEFNQEEYDAKLSIVEDLIKEAMTNLTELQSMKAHKSLYDAQVTAQSLFDIISNV